MAHLAGDVASGHMRAQLRALSAVLRSLDVKAAEASERGPLERDIANAIRDEDEPAVIAAVRRLAALDRPTAPPLDWSVASSG